MLLLLLFFVFVCFLFFVFFFVFFCAVRSRYVISEWFPSSTLPNMLSVFFHFVFLFDLHSCIYICSCYPVANLTISYIPQKDIVNI